jgi:hypothetical protein
VVLLALEKSQNTITLSPTGYVAPFRMIPSFHVPAFAVYEESKNMFFDSELFDYGQGSSSLSKRKLLKHHFLGKSATLTTRKLTLYVEA